ncbi:MAG: hypothetical protein M3R38_05360 [Actinomycetota bacterium]|nr:hypothetical protein [Actinomycetota bacterium]
MTDLAKIDAEYRETKAKIRADEDLNYEARQRKIREAGLEYDKRRKEAEQAIEDRLRAEEEASYRKAYGPARSTLSADQEAARELRLARIRAEVTDALEGGTDDALIAYERAVRAGDLERAEVLGKVGAKYLTDTTRRRRLRQLVAENEPADRRRAKERLGEIAGEQRTHELGTALRRQVRAKEGSNV